MPKKILVTIIIILLLLSLVETKKKSKKSQSFRQSNRKTKKQKIQDHQQSYLQPNQIEFWWNALLAAFLSLAGGFCSGMTVGLNSLSMLNLEIMQKSSIQKDRKMADRILHVIHDHHLFLVTLLVGNAIVLQSLPLVVHLIMPDWAAILFSTVVVLVVAEVVPMSMSTGPQKYIIAYYGSPLVGVLIKLLFLVCYPIARGLDKLLGTEHQQRIYRRDFLTFINDKRKNLLDRIQIEFINQVMNQKNKTLKELMIPFDDLFMIEQNQPICQKLMAQISKRSYSFILIYRNQRTNIIGYVKTKEIILNYMKLSLSKHPNIIQLVNGMVSDIIMRVYSDAVALEVLSIFQLYKTRVLLVCEEVKRKDVQKKEGEESLTALQVYEPRQWVLSKQSKIIGFITLNQVLYEVANYRAVTLKKVERKLSLPEDGNQI